LSAVGSANGIVTSDDLTVVYAQNRAAWRAWLENSHAAERGVWLVLYKKGSGVPCVTYDDAVEEAVAFGWIDSRVRRVDDARYIQLFVPRKPRSAWSRSNKERVERLMAAGLMAPAGLAAVEEAKRNGAWET
jgi:uncharacterized protein YdeI (YjbR/CyaY-like superfamily)